MIVTHGRHWIRQPTFRVGVNKNDKLTKGLVGLFDGQTRTDLTSMARHSSDTSTGEMASGARVRRYTSTSSQSTQWAHQPKFAVLGPITIMAYIDVVSKVNFGGIIAKQATALTAFPYEFRLGTAATDGDLNFGRANGTNYSQWKSSAGASLVGAGNRQMVGVKSTAAAINTTPTFFANGTVSTGAFQGGSALDTNPPTDNGSSAVVVGSRNAGTTFLNGRVYWVAVWNRALSDEEMRFIWKNPWVLYQSVQREIINTEPSAAPTFNPGWVPRKLNHIGTGVY